MDTFLSEHFRLAEFLRSTDAPALASYKLTPQERANLGLLVVKVLEPTRAKFGPLLISSGGRPDAVRTPSGDTITVAMRKRGFEPSDTSDHKTFSAADIVPTKQNTAGWIALYESLKANPYVKQVIMAWKTVQGQRVPAYIHVGITTAVAPANFAFMKLDGKRVSDASFA